ncbi:MAG: DUF1573 domain-containing protein [Ferruginibacter sp.]
MKKIFAVAGLACFALGAYAQQPAISSTIVKPTEDGLTMKELDYNFGKIPQGKPVTHIFDVTNTGKDSLKISNVQASCGCTTPEWEHDKAVAPGGTTKITVGFNAAGEGPFNKVITITYNGVMSKQLTIKGEVWKTPAESAPANKAIDGLKN